MKGIKRIAVLLAVLLVALSMVCLVSCGDDKTDDTTNPTTNSTTAPTTNSNNPNGGSTGSTNNGGDNTDVENPNLVTVKVVDQNGKGISGAVVQICQGESCFSKAIVTGGDGYGSREYSGLSDERLKAKVNSVPGLDNYLTPGEYGYIYFDSGSRELTITIKKVHVEVLDQDGKSVEAAVIELTQGEQKLEDTLVTDADGIAEGFIAVDGNEVSAVVTEILSGGSYKLSKEPTYFGIGLYESTITVNKLSAYTVKLSTMQGLNVTGAKVELYDVEKNRKQKTVYTDENGVAKFENVAPGEYYVKVSHENPSYVVITEAADGKYMFGTGTTISLDVVILPEITYSVTLSDKKSGLTVLLLNADNEIVYEAVTDENGVASLNAPNGSYVAVVVTTDGTYYSPVYFEADKTAAGESTVGDTKAGESKDTPIILYTSSAHVEFKAGEKVWVKVVNAHRKTFAISTEVVYYLALYNGDEEISNDKYEGINSISLDIEGGIVVEYICIDPQAGGFADIFANAPGTHDNPIDITENVNDADSAYEREESIEKNTVIYYTYTAGKDGTLVVVANGLDVHFNGDSLGMVTDDGRHLYPISAGQSVVVAVAYFGGSDVMDASISFSVAEEKVSYSVVVHKDGTESEGVTVILYKLTDDGLVEVARGVTLENGEAVFENIAYASNYVVKVEYPEGYKAALDDELALGASTSGHFYLEIIKTGTVDLPFSFDTMNGEEIANVAENGVVWYTLYVRPSNDGTRYKLTTSNKNAVIKVFYSDTNGDDVIDLNDTPVGVSALNGDSVEYLFTSNNKIYKIAVMTENSQADSVELVYSQVETEAGATVDNAIEIEGSVTESVTVINGTTYYRYTGVAGKLTVTLTGEGKLQTVTLSMDSDPVITDAEGNTFVIEDTQGNWIYFAITSDTEGEAELTVSIEE